jgi:hypothetical protein
MYRPSVEITRRIEARPLRRPFLDFSGDDDLVAAYCDFDDMKDFARIRLISYFNLHVIAKFAADLQPNQLGAALNLLFAVRDNPDTLNPSKHMRDFRWFAEFQGRLEKFDRLHGTEAVNYFHALGKEAKSFGDYPCSQCSAPLYHNHGPVYINKAVLTRLLFMSVEEMRSIDAPSIGRDDNIGGCLKLAILIKNIKILMKPSRWEREVKPMVEEGGCAIPW